MKREMHKPVIETIINTSALALTASGVTFLLSKDIWGILLLGCGMGFEFFKYWGRKEGYW